MIWIGLDLCSWKTIVLHLKRIFNYVQDENAFFIKIYETIFIGDWVICKSKFHLFYTVMGNSQGVFSSVMAIDYLFFFSKWVYWLVFNLHTFIAHKNTKRIMKQTLSKRIVHNCLKLILKHLHICVSTLWITNTPTHFTEYSLITIFALFPFWMVIVFATNQLSKIRLDCLLSECIECDASVGFVNHCYRSRLSYPGNASHISFNHCRGCWSRPIVAAHHRFRLLLDTAYWNDRHAVPTE